jgi:ribosome-associated protein
MIDDNFTEDHEPDEEAYKSKSQVKREMHALRDLGEELLELPLEQFAKLELMDEIRDAINEARKIRQHGARKRQLQYIGKLMRDVDAEAIRQQLETLQGQSRQAVQALHRIEGWRDRLLNEGDTALAELLDQYPQGDRQMLRQLLRNAQKEQAANKPPKAARSLFRYLRELINGD